MQRLRLYLKMCCITSMSFALLLVSFLTYPLSTDYALFQDDLLEATERNYSEKEFKTAKNLAVRMQDNPAADLVETLFGFTYQATVTAITTPAIGNLLKYVATSQDPTFPILTGFVDQSGLYMTVCSTVITNKAKIATILARAQRLPAYNDIYNFKAYKTLVCGLETVIFVDNSNQYIILKGALITNSPYENLIFNASILAIPNDFATSLYRSARKLTYLLEGSSNACKTMYVVGEPNCPICNDLYEATLPYVLSGELSIHWTWVTFINSTSRGRVFAIWDGAIPAGTNYPRTPLGAFVYNEAFFTDQGGIPPEANPSKYAVTIANQTEPFLFQSLIGAREDIGTPFIVYKTANGQVALLYGVPQDMDTFVNSIQVKSCKKTCKNP